MTVYWVLGLEAEFTLGARLSDKDAAAAAKKKKFEEERAAAAAQREVLEHSSVCAVADCLQTSEGTDGRLELGAATDDPVEQFMAVKPWIGAIVAPTNYTKPEDSAPTDSLAIEWVYGFGGDSTRDNVRLSASGDIVYHVAACGLVLDVNKNAQRHIVKHTDDITCSAVSPDGKYAATGQMGKGLEIIVWTPPPWSWLLASRPLTAAPSSQWTSPVTARCTLFSSACTCRS